MHSRVVAALRRLERERRTGVFKTTSDDVRREVSLEEGAIVGAHSSALDERLGEIMVRRGRITQRQLDDASLLVRSGRRLGDALVELEIVTRDEIESAVRAQLAEIASKLLTEPPKRLEFRDAPAVGKVASTPVPVADAILTAARNAAPSVDEIKALLEGSMVPGLTPESFAVLESLSLNSHEAFVLSRCDGSCDVRGILAQSPLPEMETARILLGLEHAGIITMKGRATSGH